MARPIKEGLDYFPLDTDIIHDIKIRKIMRSNGPQSIAVLLDLLGNIYGDHGYYMKWDDDVRFLIADDVGVSEAAVDELISKAVKVDFFDEALFSKYSVLTSVGIQKRYQKASKRKTGFCIQKPYNLLVNVDKNEVNVDKNPTSSGVNVHDNPQSKVKESKVKESKHASMHTREQAVELWENLWGFPNAVAKESFDDWINSTSEEVFYFAIETAAKNNVKARSAFKFIDRVLTDWAKQGVKTLKQAEQANQNHEQQVSNEMGGQGRHKIQLDKQPSSFKVSDLPF